MLGISCFSAIGCRCCFVYIIVCHSLLYLLHTWYLKNQTYSKKTPQSNANNAVSFCGPRRSGGRDVDSNPPSPIHIRIVARGSGYRYCCFLFVGVFLGRFQIQDTLAAFTNVCCCLLFPN